MNRIFQITVCGLVVVILGGCSGSKQKQDDPIWKDVKLRDLATPDVNGQTDSQLKTINFNIFIYEMPAAKIADLNDIWQVLYTRQLQFNNYDAFRANSFKVGFGQNGQSWDKIGEVLGKAGAKESELLSLFLMNGQSDYVSIAVLQNEQTVWYFPRGDAIEGATLGPGEITLKIRAQVTAEQRGVCKVEMQPAFPPRILGSIEKMVGQKNGDFLFSSCRLRLKMGVGDFIFLGPDNYIADKITLGSLFFSRIGRIPAVRAYLIVCTNIND
jgi:hypothetical protein